GEPFADRRWGAAHFSGRSTGRWLAPKPGASPAGAATPPAPLQNGKWHDDERIAPMPCHPPDGNRAPPFPTPLQRTHGTQVVRRMELDRDEGARWLPRFVRGGHTVWAGGCSRRRHRV